MALSENDKFKKRVLALKEHLPKKWVKPFLEQHPEYDTRDGSLRLYNVVNLRTVDEDVLKKLEELYLNTEKF